MKSFIELLPKHACSLTIEHNDHKTYYQTAAEWIEENRFYEFCSEDDKQKCIDTNEIWTMQWYPDTPIGFFSIAAPTLEALIDYANNGIIE